MITVVVILWLPGVSYSQESALIPIKLQLKWKHQFQFAGYYAALKKGYYKKAGLAVTLVEGGSGNGPRAGRALLSGRDVRVH